MSERARRIGWLALALAAAGLAVACGGGGDGDNDLRALVRAYIGTKADLPPGIARIELTVADKNGTAAQISTIVLANLGDDHPIEFLVRLKPGVWTFTVVCWNDVGFGLYRGSREAEVELGQPLDLFITMTGYGRVTGTITYPDGTPLTDYAETAFDINLETDGRGYYSAEAPIGVVPLRVQPSPTSVAFAETNLDDAGGTASADMVVIPAFDETQPWLSSLVPSTHLLPEDIVRVFGLGFRIAGDPVVWFGTPGVGSIATIVDPGDEESLVVAVPNGAAEIGAVYVCRTGDETCSNGVPYRLD